MLLPVRTVAPAVALLTAAELKAQSRIDDAAEDALLATLIASVTATLDGWGGMLGRALITQTWTQGLPGFDAMIRLPLAPVQSASIAYVDADGATQALTGAYRLHADARSPYLARIADAVLPKLADREDAVIVTMICGYGPAASDVPADIRQAAALLAAHLYEHREAVAPVQFHQLPLGAQWLLERYRRLEA
jgi:uncharacterized phiE125 gp8 family phage protein